jgi:ATP-dependent Clp protease adaptor protein ClpS
MGIGMGDNERQTDGQLLERTRHETKKPELFKVLLLNDDYTTMEFVVEILENVFHKQPAEESGFPLLAAMEPE